MYNPISDMEEAFRRMVLDVMVANCDDHTKNFSFLMRKGEG
jgi:serine/threonine-protein kinase HipA